MVKIQAPADCGNAPKKLFVKDFIVAMVSNDEDFLSRNITDDVEWQLIGGKQLAGRDAVLKGIRQLRGAGITGLTIRTIVTHGYDGVAEGVLEYKNGKQAAFCDVFRFKSSTNNAPVKGIHTYAINLAAN
ncbi:nuclear transport factor 2 family protein [Chitinophaga sp. CB10]|uniref:nuclear transport factor 2 family protein n=1 Tax=Chitinophaga sp. CB10 TaxID=1891659 RepID=UPI0025C0C5C6|nr:nuclear transport factor 2 family protein [Chitinophaga sp. CB10]